MDATHRAVGFSNLDYYEESSKSSLDKASAIKLCLPFISLNSGPNYSISKRQRITLYENFLHMLFFWSVCTIIL
jgi:hypothetical protein